MKLPFRYIIILVIVSLTAIFAYQVYLLANMYKTEKTQLEATVLMAIKNADHVELFLRVDSVAARQEKERRLITAVNPEDNNMSYTITLKRGGADTLIADINREIVTDSVNIREIERIQKSLRDEEIKMGESYQSMEMLVTQAQRGLHSAMDKYIGGINIQKFDSVLNDNLQEAKLNIRHFTQIVSLVDGSIVTSNMPDDIDETKYSRYQHIYDIHNEYAYVVYTESVTSIVMKQMGGILSSSFIILIVLGVSFWFLISTIMEQKTLDEMKSDFTSNITHELKTPISVAYAANDALLNFNQAEDKSKRDKYLAISQEQLQKLSGLVEQILSMSMEHRKGFRLNVENVHINPLVNSLIEQHKLKSDREIDIEAEFECDDIYIKTDRIHFSNIISNLIDNAIKYSKKEIFVRVCCRTKGDKMEITVSDRGIGIAAEKRKHIFEKFYRVPTGKLHDVKGYGLGLFYVRTMADELGGSIFVESEPGKGSIFRLLI